MDSKLEQSSPDEPVLHKMDMKENTLFTSKLLVGIVIVIILGIGTGYMLSKNKSLSPVTSGNITTSGNKVTVGSNDTKTFKDVAEGVLKEGGISGEGQYHLVRVGGDSQNVYLTSSLVDLSQFLGKKIKVWGQTQTAKKAGWLMDVGRVEVSQ